METKYTNTLAFLISLLPKIHNNEISREILLILPRFFLNENRNIALESIKVTGEKGDISVLDKLFYVIEEGDTKLRIEAIKALGHIKPPLIHERLIEYYNLFSDRDSKLEILRLLNSKYYKSKEVVNLNRSIISDDSSEDVFKLVSVSGLVRYGDYSFISYLFPHGKPELMIEVLKNIVEFNGIEIEEFLKRQINNSRFFTNEVLGYYLCAYTLKVGGAKVSILNRILNERDIHTIKAYLDLCEKGIYHTSFAKRIFRIILSFSYFDYSPKDSKGSIEERVRKLINNIVKIANEKSSNDIRELVHTCNIQLANLFKNLTISHISLSNIKYKDEIYKRLLAQMFESKIPNDVLEDVLDYFKSKYHRNASLLISYLMQYAKSSEEKRLIEACAPLFYESDDRKRLQIYSILKKVNPNVRYIVKRIARIIYSLSLLNDRTALKKIEEIYNFSIEEKFVEIESEAIILLSKLRPTLVEHKIKKILISKTNSDKILFYAAIKSIPWVYASSISKLDRDIITKDFFISLTDKNLTESFLEALFKLNPGIPYGILLKILDNIEIFKRFNLLDKAINLISEKSDWSIFQPLKSYLYHENLDVRYACIEIFRAMKRKALDLNSELLINALYDFLERFETNKKDDLYAYVISLLMELGDDYSFTIFDSIVEDKNYKMALRIIYQLPYYTIKKIFFKALKLIELLDEGEILKLKNYFLSFPDDFLNDEIEKLIIKEIKSFAERGKKVFVSEKTEKYQNKVSLIERPKLEFRIQYEQTKRVAVFFIDIVNYTNLSSTLNLTGLMKVVNSFEKIVISTVEDFNGRIVKKMGDGILAVFNHPLNSVIAGLIIQEKINNYNDFASLSEKFRARIGIHAGSVVFRNSDIFGDTVNIASRIESMADAGTVLVSEDVYNATKDFIDFTEKGPLELKGVKEVIISFIPEKLSNELSKYLEIGNFNKKSILSSEIRGEIARKLRVIMFNPDFIVPSGFKKKYDIFEIRKIFKSFGKFAEDIAKDYLEEYSIKAWLQNKWNEILKEGN